MILSPRLKLLVLGTSVSIVLFSWSVYDSLTKSVNYLSFFVELTDDLKLGILLLFQSLLFVWIDYILSLIIFGELRIIESEHVAEKLPIFIINLCFNLSISDFNLVFNGFLLSLTASLKFFHIILIDRLEHIGVRILNMSDHEVYTPRMFIKDWFGNLSVWLTLVFIIVDFSLAKFLVYDVFEGINTITYLLYGFQSAIQGVEALSFFSKALLNIYESWTYRVTRSSDELSDQAGDEDQEYMESEMERIWENKPYYSKSVEVISASLRAVSYIIFIYLLTLSSSVPWPFSMIQGAYSSIRQSYTEVVQFVQFFESSKRLDKYLENAKKEDLEDSDSLCIICRDDMYSIEDYENTSGKKLPLRKYPKKLKCNHILHAGCLKSWLERSENCPLCRKNVFQDDNPSSATNNSTHDTASENEPPDSPDFPQRGMDDLTQNTVMAASEGVRNRSDYLRNSTSSHSISNLQNSSREATSNEVVRDHIINLPSTSVVPPGWSILPIKKSRESEYRFTVSTEQNGILTVKDNRSRNDLDIIQNFDEVKSSTNAPL